MESVVVVTPEPPEAVDQSPERAEYLSRAIAALATVMVDSMLADLAAGSTDSPGLTDRAMTMALKPWIPKLRSVFLSRLSEADPAGLERLLGAASSTIETILTQAPGDPLPRWTYEWLPGQPRPHLVQLDPRP